MTGNLQRQKYWRDVHLSDYVERELARDTDYRKMFDSKMDSKVRQVKLDPATIVRSPNLNSFFEVDPEIVEKCAWDIYMNGYRDDHPLWVGIIDNKKYIILGHDRHAALVFLCRNRDTFCEWENPKIPCLVKPMTWDDFDRLSSLIVLDSPDSKTLTQPQHRDAWVNLLTYPHYWVLTDIELANKCGVKYSTVNRWRKRARKRLRDDERISPNRKTEMNGLIESQRRVEQTRDKNGKRRIRQLPGQEPQIDPSYKSWHNEPAFTRWLEKNIGVLSDATGLLLSNVRREQAAGDFSVDLVAEDESENLVIIENQLGESDHKHLGQVITYLVEQDAKTAIWIVGEARPGHINVISRLNESFPASFYLLKLEKGSSSSEPLLTTIVNPSMDRQDVVQKKHCSQLLLPSYH